MQVADNRFFFFEELASIPCKTANKVAVVKQHLIAQLTPLYPHLNLAQLDPG